jgi:hypothetical protein
MNLCVLSAMIVVISCSDILGDRDINMWTCSGFANIAYILLNPISVLFSDKRQPVYCRQYEMRIQVMILDFHVVIPCENKVIRLIYLR